ncbi:sugar-phosphate:phosphate translocator, DMT family [Galdieria sulphuraria]|uniref:Sugar-phosphate:phosphate translocator, DMT family n=1 Tax=Galdieria sulphuraria TaxID=130081 RepID=B5AJS9_GALSU|nr:sugar-phosphate:phosphate translocator, DMT family [Galdieria sulphuraria]ACF72677.1 triosephosphate/phosphate translocator [Galdieria sulphuraria]EME30492.1 sugar-phosphate:phosphate translocator, DMT family [Galdieria sulphuraria]|eukprot:XP_005707012.1 sugar-phosphate:phosphate translocator, DMT family [Galdieria sulphuraria]
MDMDFRKTLKHSLNHFVFISSHSIWKSTNECVFKDKYALRRWSCPMRKFDWITRQYLVAKARRLPQFYCLANTSLDEPSKESIKVTEASQPSQNTASWKRQLKVASYFFLWYAFNIVYNISNKKLLNAYPFPWTVAWVQLAVGVFYVVPLWLLHLRKAPHIPLEDIKRLLPVAAAHTIGHISTVVSLGAVAISFTHVVKALEPFVNVLASAVILRSVFPIPVYLSLLPVVGGVIIASVTELSFTWTGFMAAMLSNFAFTSRNIFSKISMNDQTSYKHMSPANLFAVLTILSTFILLPVALILEGPKLYQGWILATSGKTTSMQLITGLLTSGLFFYLYNEVAFYALDSVHPITHSVGNTMKRVVIIITSLLVFKNPITPANAIGSAIAISGVLLYSLTKYYYSQKIK